MLSFLLVDDATAWEMVDFVPGFRPSDLNVAGWSCKHPAPKPVVQIGVVM